MGVQNEVTSVGFDGRGFELDGVPQERYEGNLPDEPEEEDRWRRWLRDLVGIFGWNGLGASRVHKILQKKSELGAQMYCMLCV